jgi:hypothetical protein
VYIQRIIVVKIKKVNIMLKSIMVKVSNLFKSKLSIKVAELEKRIIELEAINKREEEYRKNKARKYNKQK